MGIVRAADDVESVVLGAGGGAEVTAPLLLLRDDHKEDADAKIQVEEEVGSCGRAGRGGSLSMVLLSTAVAVCGSFEFGTCVSGLSFLPLLY